MPTVVCSMCDKTEQRCECDRYCCICMGQDGVNLCMDGLYYCPACRDVCEVSLANPGEQSRVPSPDSPQS